MRRNVRVPAVLALALILALAVAWPLARWWPLRRSEPLAPATPDPAAAPAPSPQAPSPEAQADNWLRQLSLEEKVGQLLLVGLPGPELGAEQRQLLRQGRLGGIVLFGRNVQDPAQVQALIGAAQSAATGAADGPRPGQGVPLFVAVDQEGGAVARLQRGFTEWPGNMALGAAGDPGRTEQVARAMGDELRAVGFNLDLAPDVDVNDNPANPVIGVRSFGEDPALVARLGAAYVRGMQAAGVLAVAKHFPGHGNTGVDSHLALPTVTRSRADLQRIELVPFQAAIAAGAGGVMSGHLLVPALDPAPRPATLSPLILGNLLRQDLGFGGLVFTDSLDGMQAITDHWTRDEAMLQALRAGADVLLYATSFGQQAALVDRLAQAVRAGELSQAAVDAKVRRVLLAKARFGLPAPRPGSGAATAIGGSAEHAALALQAARAAVTAVRSGAPLPLRRSSRVLLLTPAIAARSNAEESPDRSRSDLGERLRPGVARLQELTLSYDVLPAQRQQALAMAAQADVVLLGITDASDSLRLLYADLRRSGQPVVVLALREPYDLRYFAEAPALLAAYGWFAPNAAALAEVLLGRRTAPGHLPVTIPGLAARGAGG